ncbi:peptidase associated/transthyretin-like domain-containing protein [Winogradskyella tangerina]|uniref:carboxypeptidase regulatory-like domain-containing protein n=1 Tax=Winogradskyella tangerina TaxID=2023240 RepID=UPI000DBE060B|nr:carboxypeptidase regulatory-like domain-containing protein [Winogradskyella tangerina]
MKKIFLLCLFLGQLSCSSDDSTQQLCTTVYVYGLNITVKDAVTDAVLTDNINVIARDGDYEETLMTIEGSDGFFGAGEREGNYTIEITSPNYQTFTSNVITVESTRDGCHVETEVLEFRVTPN